MFAEQALWTGYEQTMRRLGFNDTAPLYVASGLLSYMGYRGAISSCCSAARSGP